MVDITAAFLQRVLEASNESSSAKKQIRDRILPKQPNHSPFMSKLNEVRRAINEITQSIESSKRDYLNPFEYLHTHSSTWTDAQRKSFEESIREKIDSCHKKLKTLAMELKSMDQGRATGKKDQLTHYENTILILEEYLKYSYGEFHVLFMERNSKARPESSTRISGRKVIQGDYDLENDPLDTPDQHQFAEHEDQDFIKSLELENEYLISDMEVETVRNIERTVMEISSLNQLFSTKILEQAESIQDLHTQSVQTNENIKRGNKKLEEASEQAFNFRGFIVFYLLVLAFALLFLDYLG